MLYNPPMGGGSSDPYVTGNPATSTPGSIPPGAAIEQPQREIVNVITAASLTPSATDMTQLLQAILNLAISSFQVFTTSGTFTVPAHVTKIMVEVWGAGSRLVGWKAS